MKLLYKLLSGVVITVGGCSDNLACGADKSDENLPIVWVSSLEEQERWIPTFTTLGEFQSQVLKVAPGLRKPIFFILDDWFCMCGLIVQEGGEILLATIAHPAKKERFEKEKCFGSLTRWLDENGAAMQKTPDRTGDMAFKYWNTHRVQVKLQNPDRVEWRIVGLTAVTYRLIPPHLPPGSPPPKSLVVKFYAGEKFARPGANGQGHSVELLVPISVE